jgi:hypothetical protein
MNDDCIESVVPIARSIRRSWAAAFTIATLASAAFLCIAAASAADLTGTYMADDGGIYYVQQSGNVLWWAGLSLDHELPPDLQWHRGLDFTNVFRGTINSDNTLAGEWSDVSRGTTLNYGTLKLAIGNAGGVIQFTKVSSTGGFGATTWTRTDPLDDTKVNGVKSDIYSKFESVHKNGGETLLHDLKPYRDATVFYGQLMTSGMDTHFDLQTGLYYETVTHEDPLVNYPDWGHANREWDAFACANSGDDGQKDGDFDLRVKIDLSKLEQSFYALGWENHASAPDILRSKLASPLAQNALGVSSRFGYLHPEAVEYGRPGQCFLALTPPPPHFAFVPDSTGGPSLLPGWADLYPNSLLINGRPINGLFQRTGAPDPTCDFVQPCPYFASTADAKPSGIQIGNLTLAAGSYVRITGPLVLDCGHGITTPCFDDPSNPAEVSAYQNQEIHPVYSIDVLNSPFTPEDVGVAARENLTGAWGGSDGSTYYVRQIGNTIWGLGMLRDRQPSQQATSYDLIGTPQVAAAALLVGSPVCSSSMRCWMFATVFKGTITENADGTAIIQGDWAGVPQSTSPGSTGGSVKLSVDVYRKTMTPLTMQGIYPDKLEKLYEPEDTTPPQSTLTIGTPRYPAAASQPFVTSATSFAVTASDSDSGVQNAWYRYFPNGTASPPSYTSVNGSSATFYLSGPDGLYEVDTYATDKAGNDEPAHIHLVYLDNTAPTITITRPAAIQYPHSTMLALDYSVVDGQGSGVASFTATMDGATALPDGHGLQSGPPAINFLTEMTLGTHVFSISALDNVATARMLSVTFSIVVTAGSIKDDVKYFQSIGAITQDEATSLLQKLNAAAAQRAAGDCKSAGAIYQAFTDELRAQSGKKVSVQAAAIMIADAQYLIAHCP